MKLDVPMVEAIKDWNRAVSEQDRLLLRRIMTRLRQKFQKDSEK